MYELSHIVYTRYNPPPQIGLHCTDPTRTQQHFKDECDVNNILAKFMRTGILDQLRGGAYIDVSESPEYQHALHLIMSANEAFQTLPSNIRKEFDNNPAKYMEFMHNPANHEKAQKLGLTNSPFIQKPLPEAKSELS